MHDLKEWFMSIFKRPPHTTDQADGQHDQPIEFTLTPPAELQAARDQLQEALEVVARMEEQAQVAMRDHSAGKARA